MRARGLRRRDRRSSPRRAARAPPAAAPALVAGELDPAGQPRDQPGAAQACLARPHGGHRAPPHRRRRRPGAGRWPRSSVLLADGVAAVEVGDRPRHAQRRARGRAPTACRGRRSRAAGARRRRRARRAGARARRPCCALQLAPVPASARTGARARRPPARAPPPRSCAGRPAQLVGRRPPDGDQQVDAVQQRPAEPAAVAQQSASVQRQRGVARSRTGTGSSTRRA